jgi:hypothetical protein
MDIFNKKYIAHLEAENARLIKQNAELTRANLEMVEKFVFDDHLEEEIRRLTAQNMELVDKIAYNKTPQRITAMSTSSAITQPEKKKLGENSDQTSDGTYYGRVMHEAIEQSTAKRPNDIENQKDESPEIFG